MRQLRRSYFFSAWSADALSHDLTVKNSGAVRLDLDVLPAKTICCDIRENPVSILLIQELSDEPVTFLGKSEPFHAVVACVADVVALISLVKHTQGRAIFAVGLGFFLLCGSRRENEDILYSGAFKDPSEDPFTLYEALAPSEFVVIIAVSVAD